MTTASISGARLINDRWTARAGIGVILDGSLRSDDHTVHDVEPGGLVAIGMEYLARRDSGKAPFIDLSLFIGASWALTVAPDSGRRVNYIATDARLGARAGWRVLGDTFPYAAIRIFGGPVRWERDGDGVTGTDIHHYQLAVGAATHMDRIGFHFEWSGLGERAVSAGLSTVW